MLSIVMMWNFCKFFWVEIVLTYFHRAAIIQSKYQTNALFKQKQESLSALHLCALQDPMLVTWPPPAVLCKCLVVYNPTKFGFLKVNKIGDENINACQVA